MSSYIMTETNATISLLTFNEMGVSGEINAGSIVAVVAAGVVVAIVAAAVVFASVVGMAVTDAVVEDNTVVAVVAHICCCKMFYMFLFLLFLKTL